MPLQPDYLAYLFNAGDRHQTSANHGNLISATQLAVGACWIKKYLDWNSYMHALFAATFNFGRLNWGNSRRGTLIGLHNSKVWRQVVGMVNVTLVCKTKKKIAFFLISESKVDSWYRSNSAFLIRGISRDIAGNDGPTGQIIYD